MFNNINLTEVLTIIPCLNEVQTTGAPSRENDAFRTESPSAVCTSDNNSDSACTYNKVGLFFPPIAEFAPDFSKKRFSPGIDCGSLSSEQYLNYIASFVTTMAKNQPTIFVLTTHSNRLNKIFPDTTPSNRLKQVFLGANKREFSNGCVLKITGHTVSCISKGRVTPAKKKKAVTPDNFRFAMPTPIPDGCTLYIVRHGQGVHNRISDTSYTKFDSNVKKTLMVGLVKDAPLTKCGITDAISAANWITGDMPDPKDGGPPKVVFMASMLHRSQQTTMEIYNTLQKNQACTVVTALKNIYEKISKERETRCESNKKICDHLCNPRDYVS
jgi:phosphohistidine phosphatase SixA